MNTAQPIPARPGRRKRRRPCLGLYARPTSFDEVAKQGKVRWDKFRGWHIDFRSVVFPGAEKPKRIRISKTDKAGKFESARDAERCLNIIADRAQNRPLCEVLTEYTACEMPENTVHHRWQFDFLPSKERQQERGELSLGGLRELREMPKRGYLGYWEGISVAEIHTAQLHRWREWLGTHYAHLSPPTLRNIFGAFRVFLGHLHTMGSILQVPKFPVIKLPEKARRVPDPVSLTRILAEIPEGIRGLWIARGLAGLRPSEARRLNVGNYQDGVLRIDADQSKTKKARELMIGAVVPELDAWIRAHRAGAAPWEPLFMNPTGRRGKRWQATAERTVWTAALEAAGLEWIPPNQGGRHAFATNEIGSGTDPYALRDWMGHSSLNTTQGYVSVSAVTLARRMRPKPTGEPGKKEEKA